MKLALPHPRSGSRACSVCRCGCTACRRVCPAERADGRDGAPAKPGAPLPSEAATASVTVAGGTIDIHYNTPHMRGRKIMGGLVPYGKVWRTGANPATTLITSVPLVFGTLLVPAGTHTIYTLPGADTWQLIINNQTGQWGLTYNQANGPWPRADEGQADDRAAGGDEHLVREHHGELDRVARALGDDRPLRDHHRPERIRTMKTEGK
jgi:hypothetical protein